MTGSIPIRILVVEDDPSWQEIYHQMWGKDYSLHPCLQFAEAEEALSGRHSFDLAIVDPCLDLRNQYDRAGVRVIKRICSLPSSFPVVVVTGDPATLPGREELAPAFVDLVLNKLDGIATIDRQVRRLVSKLRAIDRWRQLGMEAGGLPGIEAARLALRHLRNRTDACGVSLLVPLDRGEELVVICDTDEDEGRTTGILHPVAGRAYRDRTPVLVEDTTHEAEFKSLTKFQSVRSGLAVPVHDLDMVIGVLNVESVNPRAFNSTHVELTKVVADFVMLLARGERPARELAQWKQLFDDLLDSPLDLDRVWRSVFQAARMLVGADNVSMLTHKPAESTRIQALLVKMSTDEVREGRTINLDSIGVLSLALDDRIPHRSIDGVGAKLAVPVLVDDSDSCVLLFEKANRGEFSDEDEKLCSALANYAAHAMKSAEAARREAEVKGELQKIAIASHLIHRAGGAVYTMRDYFVRIMDDDGAFLNDDLPAIGSDFQGIIESLKDLLEVIAEIKGMLTTVRLTPTDVGECINQALDKVKARIERQGIVVTISLQPNLPSASANSKLTSVFEELLKNAADQLKDGGNIWITAEARGRVLLVHFEDDGPGIPESCQEDVFDPHWTTKPDAQPTDGFGLFTCRTWVKSWDGQISIGTSRVQGAKFTIQLRVSTD